MATTIIGTIREQNLVIPPSVISVAQTVGEYRLKITYDAQWNAVDARVVTFRGANGIAIAVPDNGEEEGVLIPWEVLNCPGKVSVGVVGYVGTEIKLTTTGLFNRNTFVVLPEACGLKAAVTPTPDIYAKIIQTIGDLSALQTEDKSSLVAAINEAYNSSGGFKVWIENTTLFFSETGGRVYIINKTLFINGTGA